MTHEAVLDAENDITVEPLTEENPFPPGQVAHVARASEAAAPGQPNRSFLFPLVNFLSSVKVRFKIAGTLIIVLSVTVITLGVVTFASQKGILQKEMKARASILVMQLASVGKEALLTNQDLPIVATIADIQKRDDVVYAMVIDNEGKVFAHSDFSRKGKILPDPVDKAALTADAMIIQETVINGDQVLDAAIPITMQANNLKIGVARIGLSQKALNEAINRQKTTYLLMALVFVISGLVVSFVLARLLTKPLDLLAEGIRVVSKGDLRSLVTVTSKDELGEVTTTFNQMILSLREKIHMEKYLSQSTVQSIKQNRDESQLRLGGERRYVTALFSDVRGFTSLSEKMSPEDVVTLMNTYLNFQAAVIHNWGGSVDKFVGDEVMAIFEGRGNEINAVRAAVEIQNYCTALNMARSADGQMPIHIGIGLNCGDAVMGNMGSENRMDYTVIGDNINIAARLCGIAQPGQVLVSSAVANEIGNLANCKALPPVAVKGKDKPLEISEVETASGCGRQYMRKDVDTEAVYSFDGYAEASNTATVKNISPGGCLLEANSPVEVGSRLRLSFSLPVLGSIDVRASVLHTSKNDVSYLLAVHFDDLHHETRSRLVRWIHHVNA